MGFFSGRVSCSRFRLLSSTTQGSAEDLLQKLQERVIGTQRFMTSDGIESGWLAGDHILDTKFDLQKNIVNDTIQFALRIDQQKIPSDLIRAYTQVELEGLAAENPSGNPSTRQKREAKQLALDKLEQEAADGRFLKRKMFPVLWDTVSNELLVATTSLTAIERLHALFQETFEIGFEPLTAGRQAFLLAEARQLTRGVDDASPSAFIPGVTPQDFAWSMDETRKDFLGNEFLMWLWFTVECGDDVITLADDSELSVMLTRTLVLECPRGETGKETITSDAPTKLAEARRAIQVGKLPRKLGMILSRHDQQYDLTFQAESLAITGAKLPAPEADQERARHEERVDQLRHLLETIDLLFDRFNSLRVTDQWPKQLSRIQTWLQEEKRPRMSA